MNPADVFFGHPVTLLRAPAEPGQRLLDSATITDWQEAESQILQIRNRTARRLRRGRLRLAQQRTSAVALQQAQWLQEKAQLHQAVLDSTVTWLTNETQLEQHLYEQALNLACDWAVQALQLWEPDIDWQAVMAIRIRDMRHILAREPNLTIRLPPGEFAQQFQATMADEGSVPLRLILDESLSARQAIVGNHLAEVRVDLDAEYADIMAQIRAAFHPGRHKDA
ncbi:hypothetical protein HAX39_24550 [Citrobacter freundii]|nr:hypothetical protein [Citrobacter freundii]